MGKKCVKGRCSLALGKLSMTEVNFLSLIFLLARVKTRRSDYYIDSNAREIIVYLVLFIHVFNLGLKCVKLSMVQTH